MRVIPAVDIRGGLCVNLVQGDFDRETVFSIDPLEQAVTWYKKGAALVHIVDLDGAKNGRIYISEILEKLHCLGVAFEVGGGIRQMRDIEHVFSLGAERAILGTSAYRNPKLLREAAKTFPNKIAVGIDARNGKVALSGWQEDTEVDAIEFALRVQDDGAARIIYTDILSDGMLKGPNFDATCALAESINIPVTISGGVSSLQDIKRAACLKMPHINSQGRIDEIIVGRALYVGAFSLEEAINAAKEFSET